MLRSRLFLGIYLFVLAGVSADILAAASVQVTVSAPNGSAAKLVGADIVESTLYSPCLSQTQKTDYYKDYLDFEISVVNDLAAGAGYNIL
jgi:hypothetical protein